MKTGAAETETRGFENIQLTDVSQGEIPGEIIRVDYNTGRCGQKLKRIASLAAAGG